MRVISGRLTEAFGDPADGSDDTDAHKIPNEGPRNHRASLPEGIGELVPFPQIALAIAIRSHAFVPDVRSQQGRGADVYAAQHANDAVEALAPVQARLSRRTRSMANQITKAGV